MRVRTMFVWMNGPHPAKGELDPDEVEVFQPTGVEAFCAALDAVLTGATRVDGPCWSWSRGDESIRIDDLETLDMDDEELWGEVEVTADCELETLLAFWSALEARGVAAWAYFEEGPMLGPDAFVSHVREAEGMHTGPSAT